MVPVDESYDVDGLDEEVPCPDTQCMVYLPTFTIKLSQM